MRPRKRASKTQMDLAIAHATEVSKTWDVKTQVLVNATGGYRVTIEGIPLLHDERLLGTVEAGGMFFTFHSQQAA